MNGPNPLTMIPLADLLSGLAEVKLADNVTVSGISDDSRTVNPGDLFVARSGSQDDGSRYISAAVAAGAVAIVAERQLIGIDVPVVCVSNVKDALPLLARRFYQNPTKNLQLIGVTGTNGKTSCTTLAAQLLENTALLGTRGYGFVSAMKPAGQTTPGSLTLHRMFRELADQGAKRVAMEVSSHALDQQRVAGLSFDIAVHTGVAHDHLDYHGDLHAYVASKRRLFSDYPYRAALINVADASGRDLATFVGGDHQLLTYGGEDADLQVEVVDRKLTGMSLELRLGAERFDLETSLLGDFNAENLLAVAGVMMLSGLSAREAVERLRRAKPVPGRMERVAGAGPTVIVDYAHNPDGLREALVALRSSRNGGGRLWCLFGCGGERDQAKRQQMGEIASGNADVVVLTDDNPRHESPLAIIDQVVSGCSAAVELHRIHDRRQAITFALQQAANDDLILIAGKGDEPDQLFAAGRWRFDDRRVAMQARHWRR